MHTMLFYLIAAQASLFGQGTGTAFPITGREVPSLAPYENALRQIMQKWSIPGASMAIMDGSRLVYARGFGFADREAGTPVQPASSFRLASISKTIAGMTILKLAEEGRLNLDAPFMTLIPDLRPAASPPPDPRMSRGTVRQLLQHTGGFDRPIDDDHVNYYNTASRVFNEPVSIDLITRYVISQRLDFDPGARYAYGNSGYQILGRIVERVTGKKFLDAAYEKILGPAGVTSVRIGGNLLSQRFPDEVKYYDYPGAPLATTAGAPGVVLPTPRPYNRRVDMADSYGGLIGNAIDMMKYLSALEGRRGPAILNPASLNAIVLRPSPPWPAAAANYTGLSWRIFSFAGGYNWWHSGGASGTRNLLHRRQDGRSWVVLMNSRPLDQDTIISDLFTAMAAAQSQVGNWPAHDLFPDFSAAALNTSAETLSFTHSPGSAVPEAQTLHVTATAGGANITVDPPTEGWLKADRLFGLAPLAISVSVDPSGLAPGDYQAQLRITAPNATNGPRLVRVNLRITRPPMFTLIRNSASQLPVLAAAPESRLTLEADDLAASRAKVAGIPEPGPFNGVTARLTDSGGITREAAIVEATPQRVDLILPAGAKLGDATIGILTHKRLLIENSISITAVSPALFSANGDGKGAALATAIRISVDDSSNSQPAYECREEPESCVPFAVDLGAETDRVNLRLSATGVRSLTDPAAFAVRIGDENAVMVSVQPSDAAGGVDLVTVRLPRSLAGRGELSVVLIAGEVESNAVKVHVK